MKQILVILLLSSTIAISQSESLSENYKFSKVFFSIHSVGPDTSQNINQIDKEFIITFSKLKSLRSLVYSTQPGSEDFKVKLIFENLESFFKWYETEETKIMLSQLDKKFKRNNLEFNFAKSIK